MTTAQDRPELIPLPELAVLARGYLTTLQQRAPVWAYGHDAHAHLLEHGHLPSRGCCAPAVAAGKAAHAA